MSRLLIFGCGDLTYRLLPLLASVPSLSAVVVAARRTDVAAHVCEVLTLGGGPRYSCVRCDARQESVVADVMARVEPDLVITAAAYVSPWRLARELASQGVDSSRARLLAAFGVQLPLQLLLPYHVARAAKAIGYRGASINASYPDAVNHVLGRFGLQPTVGIGNVHMSQLCIRARLMAAGRPDISPIRVVAHHYHTRGILTADRPAIDEDARPRVFVGMDALPADELAYAEPAANWSRESNSLTALSAVPVIRALLPGGGPLRASLPGPLGLPGGYPCIIEGHTIELDLPPNIGRDEAVALNRRAARYDGLVYQPDGEVSWTQDLQKVLAPHFLEASRPISTTWTPDYAVRLAGVLALRRRRQNRSRRG